jgi:hypothetical protein
MQRELLFMIRQSRFTEDNSRYALHARSRVLAPPKPKWAIGEENRLTREMSGSKSGISFSNGLSQGSDELGALAATKFWHILQQMTSLLSPVSRGNACGAQDCYL